VNEARGPRPAPVDVVRRLIDAFNARDVDRFLALCHRIRNPLGNAMHGIEGGRVNEQMGALVEQDGSASIDGNPHGAAPQPRHTELKSAGVFEGREGRVARLRIHMDSASDGPELKEG
jgi:hypothetical protein